LVGHRIKPVAFRPRKRFTYAGLLSWTEFFAVEVLMVFERAARNAVVRTVWLEREDVRILFFVSAMAAAAFSFTEARPFLRQTGGRSIHLTRRQSQRPDRSVFREIVGFPNAEAAG
jgi:hypothetical protein